MTTQHTDYLGATRAAYNSLTHALLYMQTDEHRLAYAGMREAQEELRQALVLAARPCRADAEPVNCIDPSSGNADFLRGIDEAFRAAKRKPTVSGPHQDTEEPVLWSLHGLTGRSLLKSTKPLTWERLNFALDLIEDGDSSLDPAYSIHCWDKQTVLDAQSIVGPAADEWGERNDLHAAVCVVDRTGGLQ